MISRSGEVIRGYGTEALLRSKLWIAAHRPGTAVRCNLCEWTGPRFAERQRCPRCKSLPRNRLVPFSLSQLGLNISQSTVLHVAANRGEALYVAAQKPQLHIRADLRPLDGFNFQGDMCNLGLESGVVDIAIAWHVLEHVPDDALAIEEVARVLRPGGAFLMSVPIHPAGNRRTRDDRTVAATDRESVFGHHDHVRSCGLDYGDRLAAAGLTVRTLACDQLDGTTLDTLGLSPAHVVWCGTAPAGQ